MTAAGTFESNFKDYYRLWRLTLKHKDYPSYAAFIEQHGKELNEILGSVPSARFNADPLEPPMLELTNNESLPRDFLTFVIDLNLPKFYDKPVTPESHHACLEEARQHFKTYGVGEHVIESLDPSHHNIAFLTAREPGVWVLTVNGKCWQFNNSQATWFFTYCPGVHGTFDSYF